MEGTGKGFDTELFYKIDKIAEISVIASGGFGKPSHLSALKKSSNIDAIALAYALHYNKCTIEEVRKEALK